MNGTREGELGCFGPGLAIFFEFLECRTIEFDEGFFDDGNHFAMAAFHVHHARERDAAGLPLGCRASEVANRADVASESLAKQQCGSEAESIGVVRIEIRRHGATSFVAEIMRLRREATLEFSGGFHFLEAGFDEVDEEALSIDAGDLDVAVRVTVEDELIGNIVRQAAVKRGSGGGKFTANEFPFLRERVQRVECIGVVREKLIEFAHQRTHLRHKFDEAFWNKNRAEFFSIGRAEGNGVGDLIHNLTKCHASLGDFFGNEGDCCASLQRAFQRNVRGGAAHELDEVPVFAGGDGVALDVADEVGINFRGRIEAEAGFDVFASQIAVDGLRNADHAEWRPLGFGKFSELAGIRI